MLIRIYLIFYVSSYPYYITSRLNSCKHLNKKFNTLFKVYHTFSATFPPIANNIIHDHVLKLCVDHGKTEYFLIRKQKSVAAVTVLHVTSTKSLG